MSKHAMTRGCDCCGNAVQFECGEPFVHYKKIFICSTCSMELVEKFYVMGGIGGIQHIVLKELLESPHNRHKRRQIKDYKKVFERLMHKYKFSCVFCGEKDKKKLSIDHIHPVARGGTDDIANLQILCKSCNSKKGAKHA